MKRPMPRPRKLIGVGSSLRDLHEMPKKVRSAFGNALWSAQLGARPADSRHFGEGLPREVLKLVENHDGDTYRAAFIAEFPECIYLLHVFRKKSASGIATPKPVIATIRSRLAWANEHHRVHFASRDEQ
jgi:phage-related protein